MLNKLKKLFIPESKPDLKILGGLLIVQCALRLDDIENSEICESHSFKKQNKNNKYFANINTRENCVRGIQLK